MLRCRRAGGLRAVYAHRSSVIIQRKPKKPNFTGAPNMADEPNSALTGAAFEPANAGYKRMSDAEKRDEDEAIGSDSASLREAAERRSRPSDEIVVREYVDKNDKPVPAEEAITLDRAVRDYVSATAADRLV